MLAWFSVIKELVVEPKRASALEIRACHVPRLHRQYMSYVTSITNRDVYLVYTEVPHSRYITFARSTHTLRAGKGLVGVC